MKWGFGQKTLKANTTGEISVLILMQAYCPLALEHLGEVPGLSQGLCQSPVYDLTGNLR